MPETKSKLRRAWKPPKIWPAAASGLLVLCCYPPFNLGLLVFVALVPWLLYLRECSGKSAFRSGMLFGFIFWIGEFSFVAKFVGHWTGSLALGCVPYLLGCFLGSFYFALFGWLANIGYRRSAAWSIALAWAGVEVFRSYIIGLAFPFGLLAMPLTPVPALIQAAHYGSVYFVSAWVVVANLIGAELMAGKGYVGVRWYALAFVLVLGVSIGRFLSQPEGDARLVVAGQPGIDIAFGDPDRLESRIADTVDQLSLAVSGADLMVLPEGIARSSNIPPPNILFKVSSSLPVVFGGQRGENPAHQSAFSYDGHWDYADKTRLVIFGEYVPFRSYLPFLDKFNLPGGDLVPGENVKTLQVGKFRVGAALCFEALFPDVCYRHALKGANLLAVMSIDDWYFGTNAPEQLRDASIWRAVETGMPVVRSASLGYTLISDQRGRVLDEVPLYGTRAATATVKVPDSADVFLPMPVFPYLSLAFVVLIPLYDTIARKKSRA